LIAKLLKEGELVSPSPIAVRKFVTLSLVSHVAPSDKFVRTCAATVFVENLKAFVHVTLVAAKMWPFVVL
jgi:hypothetical protein